MLSRRDAVQLLMTAPLAAIPACTRSAAPRARRALKIGVMPHLPMGPAYLASERGFFTEEGLDVTLVSSNASREAIPLLSGGKVDAALVSFTGSLINVMLRGARVRIV